MITHKAILDRLYPSIVTWNTNWRAAIDEVTRHKLTAVSLFLTTAFDDERKEIFDTLLDSTVESIPHVHIRNDMREDELDFLVENFGTRAMTLHYQYLPEFVGSKHLKKIFVENNQEVDKIVDPSRLAEVGGACIDLSHYKEFSVHKLDIHKQTEDIVQRFHVGCNHISGVGPDDIQRHKISSTDELSYLAELPEYLFSDLLCLELQNTITEQLQYREYIADLLYETWTAQ